MTVVKKFCGIFKLRTGAIIIGCIGMMNSIPEFYFTYQFINSFKREPTDNDATVSFNFYLQIIICIFACLQLVNVFEHAKLISGVKANRKSALRPWLISKGISAVISTTIIISGGISCLFIEDMEFTGTVILSVGIPICGFLSYCWLCVFCLYRRFDNEVLILQDHIEETRLLLDIPITYTQLQYNY